MERKYNPEKNSERKYNSRKPGRLVTAAAGLALLLVGCYPRYLRDLDKGLKAAYFEGKGRTLPDGYAVIYHTNNRRIVIGKQTNGKDIKVLTPKQFKKRYGGSLEELFTGPELIKPLQFSNLIVWEDYNSALDTYKNLEAKLSLREKEKLLLAFNTVASREYEVICKRHSWIKTDRATGQQTNLTDEGKIYVVLAAQNLRN